MKIALILLCLCAHANAATIHSSFTESRTVTIPADIPVSYDTSVEAIFAIDDVTNRVTLILGSVSSVTADIPPIIRTTVFDRFIPGDFPVPGTTVEVTRVETIDFNAIPLQTAVPVQQPFKIRENGGVFFFNFVARTARFPGNPVDITGLHTISESIDGAEPQIQSVDFSNWVGGEAVASIRIHPDFSLSLMSGSLFDTTNVLGVDLVIAVVPEPSSMLLALMAGLVFGRRLSRRLLDSPS